VKSGNKEIEEEKKDGAKPGPNLAVMTKEAKPFRRRMEQNVIDKYVKTC
jgi:hypothetical protein